MCFSPPSGHQATCQTLWPSRQSSSHSFEIQVIIQLCVKQWLPTTAQVSMTPLQYLSSRTNIPEWHLCYMKLNIRPVDSFPLRGGGEKCEARMAMALCARNCGSHLTNLTWDSHSIPSGYVLNLRRGNNSSVRLNDLSRLCFFNKYSRSSNNVSFKVIALQYWWDALGTKILFTLIIMQLVSLSIISPVSDVKWGLTW